MSSVNAEITPVIGTDYSKTVVPVLQEAGQTLDIMMYEWKWYSYEAAGGVEKFNLAVQAASRRGVKTRVLLNTEAFGHAITKINAKTAQFLKLAGVEVKFGQIGQATHAKMLIIDKRILILGSHNISKGSFSRNQEASIIVRGGEATRPYLDYFELLWRQTF